jgi:hypothetical protein
MSDEVGDVAVAQPFEVSTCGDVVRTRERARDHLWAERGAVAAGGDADVFAEVVAEVLDAAEPGGSSDVGEWVRGGFQQFLRAPNPLRGDPSDRGAAAIARHGRRVKKMIGGKAGWVDEGFSFASS